MPESFPPPEQILARRIARLAETTALATAIQRRLQSVLPDSPLAHVRCTPEAQEIEATVVIEIFTGASIQWQEAGFLTVRRAQVRAWPLPLSVAREYLAWLEAGNMALPPDWRLLVQKRDACIVPPERA